MLQIYVDKYQVEMYQIEIPGRDVEVLVLSTQEVTQYIFQGYLEGLTSRWF